jgi:hypothetical protein
MQGESAGPTNVGMGANDHWTTLDENKAPAPFTDSPCRSAPHLVKQGRSLTRGRAASQERTNSDGKQSEAVENDNGKTPSSTSNSSVFAPCV